MRQDKLTNNVYAETSSKWTTDSIPLPEDTDTDETEVKGQTWSKLVRWKEILTRAFHNHHSCLESNLQFHTRKELIIQHQANDTENKKTLRSNKQMTSPHPSPYPPNKQRKKKLYKVLLLLLLLIFQNNDQPILWSIQTNSLISLLILLWGNGNEVATHCVHVVIDWKVKDDELNTMGLHFASILSFIPTKKK